MSKAAVEFDILPIEPRDAEEVSNIVCDSFGDQTYGPYGPGGSHVWLLYPHMDTAEGRKRVEERYGKLAAKLHETDPMSFVKAQEKSTGKIAGLLLLEDIENPSRETVVSTMPDRASFDSEEEFQHMLRLREDRDEVNWRAVSQLPKGPVINLKLLVISPKFQSRGVGSLLTKYAVKRGDDKGWNMFVQASEIPAAMRVYERSGFVLKEDTYIPLDSQDDAKVIRTRIPVLLREHFKADS